MKNNVFRLAFFLSAFAAVCFFPTAFAEEFHCEVLSLAGSASATDADGKVRLLQEGDLVAKGEIVTTEADSVLDLSFDKDWKNVTRLEAKSKLKIASVYPGKLELAAGGVFARLKALPKDSAFQVKTPTAVATVRGTEYRTTFIGGRTEVSNVSPSKVFVYGVKADGSADTAQEVVLERSQKTQVPEAGKAPEPSQELPAEEAEATEELKTLIEANVQKVQEEGRTSAIQSVTEMEAQGAAEKEALKKQAAAQQLDPNDSDESRVVDLRRRPFKKVD